MLGRTAAGRRIRYLLALALGVCGGFGSVPQVAGASDGAGADVSLTMSVAPKPALAGAPLTYTLTVRNDGPEDAEDVQLSFDFDNSNTIDTSPPEIGCEIVPRPFSILFVCDLGDVAAGEELEMTVTLWPGAATHIETFVSVTSATPDPRRGNNATRRDIPVGEPAELTLTRTGVPDPAFVGQPLLHDLTVTNHGPGTAEAVRVLDALPNGLLVEHVTADQGTCAPSGPRVTCRLGDIDAGQTVLVRTVARPQRAGLLVSTATVAAANAYPLPAAAEQETQVFPAACQAPGAILGTEGDDVLDGTLGPDTVCAGGGADLVRGLAGADLILGGDGDDDLGGGRGTDRMEGEHGDDLVRGNRGQDRLFGGPGSDVLQAMDGVLDRVDCGPDLDLVAADPFDLLLGCP